MTEAPEGYEPHLPAQTSQLIAKLLDDFREPRLSSFTNHDELIAALARRELVLNLADHLARDQEEGRNV